MFDAEFFKGKRVFVTGHTGFKGSWLCKLLVQCGAEVYGYSLNPPTNPSMYSLLNIDRIVHSTVGDIRDLKAIGDNPKNLKLDEKEKLLSELGMQMVKDPNAVSDELINNLKKHFSDSEIVTIVGFAAQMMATNNFNAVLKIDLDDSLVPIADEFEKETWRAKNK